MNKHISIRMLFLCFTLTMAWGCKDDYLYLKESPEQMENSLYARLQSDGRFSTYVQLLQRMDSAYIAVLDRTGSRTLFVPTDEAFAAFFQNNPEGYKSVSDMPTSVIKSFLSYYTLENAYVSSVLGTAAGPEIGGALRRFTTYERTDSIPYTDKYPDNPQFARFNGEKMYLNTPGNWTLVHFTEPYFRLAGMTADDYNKFYPQSPWQTNDIALFDAKVIERDIVGMNGYIHVVDKVVLPPKNMYEYLRDKAGDGTDEGIDIFRRLMERFCEPVFDAASTKSLQDRNPNVRDSVYNIGFFYTGDRYILDTYGNPIKVDNLLFSPAENGTQVGVQGVGAPPREMPAMLVPTNKAMQEYLDGSFFKNYGSWESVPDNIVVKFVNTHMKLLFSNSYPSRLSSIVDDVKGDLMFRDFKYERDIKDVQICRNGAVYTINKVIQPREFSTVVAPILNDPRTQIANWLINANYNNKLLKYNYFLTSLENRFTFFVPVDEAFRFYLDPVNQVDGIAGGKKTLSFSYLEDLKGVTYSYNDMNGNPLAEPVVGVPDFTNIGDPVLKLVQNRLRDIFDYHIVVGDINSDQKYAQTKGGTYIKLDWQGNTLRVQGAGNVEAGTYVNIVDKFETLNGTVYFIDKRIDHTLTSPYKQLQVLPNSTLFNDMLNTYNTPDAVFTFAATTFKSTVERAKQTEYYAPVFAKKDGIDFVIPFLGSFDYTIFVPTDAAINEAITNRVIYTEAAIQGMRDDADKIDAIKRNIRFLKNHFVDKSVFTTRFYDANDEHAEDYQLPNTFTTSAKDPISKVFYTVTVSGGEGTPLVVKDKQGKSATTVNGATDILARQYRLTGTSIGSNSRAVIHQIDHALTIPSN